MNEQERNMLRFGGFAAAALSLGLLIALLSALRRTGAHPLRAAHDAVRETYEPFEDAAFDFVGLGVPDHSRADEVADVTLAAIGVADAVRRRRAEHD